MFTGLGHSTTSEKSSPYLHQGMFSTHMVPDLARWPDSLRGKLLFGASERPLNHPGADLDDPIVPELEDGAHSDGQNPSFYVKWQNLTVRMCSILQFWHYRIVQFGPRVVQEPFRGSKKQFASEGIWPSGKIGYHMGQNHTLVQVWGALFRSGAVACTSDYSGASGDNK